MDGNEGTYGVPRIVRAMWDSGMGMKGHAESLGQSVPCGTVGWE